MSRRGGGLQAASVRGVAGSFERRVADQREANRRAAEAALAARPPAPTAAEVAAMEARSQALVREFDEAMLAVGGVQPSLRWQSASPWRAYASREPEPAPRRRWRRAPEQPSGAQRSHWLFSRFGYNYGPSLSFDTRTGLFVCEDIASLSAAAFVAQAEIKWPWKAGYKDAPDRQPGSWNAGVVIEDLIKLAVRMVTE